MDIRLKLVVVGAMIWSVLVMVAMMPMMISHLNYTGLFSCAIASFSLSITIPRLLFMLVEDWRTEYSKAKG